MTTTPAAPPTTADDHHLAGFGYRPQLRRDVGGYASFAAGFSFVSILTTVFQLFAFGYGFAGPVVSWTWLIVLGGQLTVALTFAELVARYPLSGAIYQWSTRLAGARAGWYTGWTMIIAQVITFAAAAIALQGVLPAIWGGFQVVGGDPALGTPTGATNAVVLASALIVVTTTINAIGVRLTAIVSSVGVTLELIGVAAVVVLLLFNLERGPGVVLDVDGAGFDPTFGAFLASGLMAAYVLVGFNSAAELAEETTDPRRTAPRTILRAVLVSGVGGGLLLLVGLMAAPSLDDGRLATEGLPYVLTSQLGPVGGRILLVDVAVAVLVCALAIQTAAARMVFSMSRDGQLPAARVLGGVSRRTGTPVVASVLVGLGGIAVLVVNIGQPGLFTALTSVCIVMIYLAYLMVTAPMLVRRLRNPQEFRHDDGHFSLGRWGLAVNAVAVAYGAAMVVNLAWPRAAVYDPAGEDPVLRFSAVLVVAVVLLAGGSTGRTVSSRSAVKTRGK
ncbi:amino acid permease, partial [Kineococcus glutinatus]|uniref:amino acid permease n=1 Tax=Kineococcus glutinatus TaxID=1070872 RepID=UPI0031E9ABA0